MTYQTAVPTSAACFKAPELRISLPSACSNQYLVP